MIKKKGTRPGAGTPRRAMEAGTGQTTTSAFDFTTLAPMGQGVHIADLLSHGAENGTSTRELMGLLGVPERTVRKMIQMERLAGVPILSNTLDGYYLPTNNAEVVSCVRSLRHRGQEILRAANAISKACNSETLEGQIFLDGSF